MVLTLLLALAIAWTWWRMRMRRYRATFRIPAQRNDHCVCRGGHAAVTVTVGVRGLEIPPDTVRPGQTALLCLNVAATHAGQVFDPFIDVQAGAVRYRQYFERGAAGLRYLNISPAVEGLPDGSPPTLTLRGHHIRWQAAGSITAFDPPALEGGDTLILAPHPDDSEIGAFGLYSTRPSWVVTVTAGERTPTDISAIVPEAAERSGWLALLRVNDSLTVPMLGGVDAQRCVNLAFPDAARLKQMNDNPGKAVQLACESFVPRRLLRSRNSIAEFRNATSDCRWADLVGDIARVLDAARPRIVSCPHPLLDPHLDHVFSSLALAEALRGTTHVPEILLLYAVHVREAPVYPYGAADSIVSVLPWEDAGWIADSILSLPLSDHTRRAKYFSVEAAHDLRHYENSRARTLRELLRVLRRETAAFVGGTALNPADLLRRAPRPNEVYYVASPETFQGLAERARLAQRSVPSTAL